MSETPLRPGLLLNENLLARFQRAFLQDSPTPGGSLRFAHRGLISFTPPACEPAARKGCEDISPGLSEAIPGVTATLYTNARRRRARRNWRFSNSPGQEGQIRSSQFERELLTQDTIVGNSA